MNEGTRKERTATCLCRQLQVVVRGEPQRVMACHCTLCKRRTGGAFGLGAYYLRTDQVEVRGEHRTFRKQAASGREGDNHFCPDCGTSVFWDSTLAPETFGVAVGCFDDPHFPQPVAAVWGEEKLDWLNFPEDIPVLDRQDFSKMPKK